MNLPKIIDNNRKFLKDVLVEVSKDYSEVSIATGYWDLEGMKLLLDSIKGYKKIRLLIGREPMIARYSLQIPEEDYPDKEEYAKGDTDYKTLVSTTISLARRARTIFDSSEPAEKRVILNYLLQNPTVNGKKLVFTLKKPWDTVLELASTPDWLPEQVLNLLTQDPVRVFDVSKNKKSDGDGSVSLDPECYK